MVLRQNRKYWVCFDFKESKCSDAYVHFFVKVDGFKEGHKNFTKSLSSVKNKREISLNFVAFSEYMNFF